MPAGESDFQWLVITRLAGNLSISLIKYIIYIYINSVAFKKWTQYLPYLSLPVEKPYKLREVKIGIVVTNLSKALFEIPL